MIKIIGQILLWLGFLSGSLVTVMNTEVKPEAPADGSPVDPWATWQTINWQWYGVAFAVCLVGVVLIRIHKRQSGGKTEATSASLGEIRQALERLVRNLERLQQDLDRLAPSEITQFIDEELTEDFRTFADGRESMIAEYGLQKFADVMSLFAAGERAVNRAWSAAADGYVDEAETCIERGLAMLRKAQEELA